MLGNAFLPTGNAHVYSRGNAVHMQFDIKEQRDCQYFGISDDQCCKQSYMSATAGAVVMKLVSTSHSDIVIKPVLEIVLIRNNMKSSYTT